MPFEIPDSWAWCHLENFVLAAFSGFVKYATEEFAENMPPYYYLQDGDVLLNTLGNGTLGRSSYYRKTNSSEFLLTDGHLFVFRTLDKAMSYYLKIYLKDKYDEIVKSANGSTNQTFLSLGKTLQWLVPVPPLSEQARIVTEIEKFEPLIAEYDKLEQQATKLDDEIYDKLKKSILQYAIQGKLVPQDPNDEPASVLLERIRAEKKAKLGKKFVDSYSYKGDDNCYYEHIAGRAQDELVEVPFDIPENWMWTRWGNLSFSIQYGYNAPAKEMGRIKMVRISDIHNNIVDWENVPFCEIKEEDISTYLLEENDILFARTGGTVGKSYLVTSIPVQAIYAGYLSFLLTAHPRAPLKSWRQTPLNFIFLPLKRTTPSFTQISRNPTFSPITSLPDSINRSYNTGVSALHARTSLHKKWTGIPSFASFFCPAILTLHSPRRAVKVSSPRLFVSIL